MPSYTFNPNVPDTPNDPKNDQPKMKANNGSLNNILNVDHYSFNDGNGGYHRQASMIEQTGATVPVAGTSGVLFAKHLNTDAWPHWKNSSTSPAVPLLSGNPVLGTSGSTYLPGGLLLVWNTIIPPGTGNQTTPFTPNFKTATVPFTIITQLQTSVAHPASPNYILTVNQSTTTNAVLGYNLQTNFTLANITIFYMALGEA